MEAKIIELGEYRLERRLRARAQGLAPRRRFLWVESASAPVQIVEFPPVTSPRAGRSDARFIPG